MFLSLKTDYFQLYFLYKKTCGLLLQKQYRKLLWSENDDILHIIINKDNTLNIINGHF